jgi:hypothetical protein
MTNKQGVRPEDILADGVDTTIINGKQVRKGTVAAFIANIEILEDARASDAAKQNALAMLKILAKDVVAVGLPKHVVFKNEVVKKLLADSEG